MRLYIDVRSEIGEGARRWDSRVRPHNRELGARETEQRVGLGGREGKGKESRPHSASLTDVLEFTEAEAEYTMKLDGHQVRVILYLAPDHLPCHVLSKGSESTASFLRISSSVGHAS